MQIIVEGNKVDWINSLTQQFSAVANNGKIILPKQIGEGYIEEIRINQLMYIRIISATFNEDLEILKMGTPDSKDTHLMFYQSKSAIEIKSHLPQIENNQNIGYLYTGKSDVYLKFPEKSKILSIILVISNDWFINSLNEFYEGVRPINEFFFKNKAITTSVPLSIDFEYPLQQMMKNRVYDEYLKLFYHSKAIELIALFFNELMIDIKGKRNFNRIDYKEQKAVFDLIEYIQNHLDQKLLIDDLAQKVGFSKSKLQRIFKHLYGKSVLEYISKLRMQRAREMLNIPEFSISDIAFSIGYSSVAHFSTAFANYFGKSPRAYRKLLINNRTEVNKKS